MPAVSVVLPCYNPPEGWAANIVAQYGQLRQLLNEDIEVILVRDGKSTNVTTEDIATLRHAIHRFTFIAYDENKGKGYATRQGVAKAAGDIIIYTDIDFPYTNKSILHIYTALSTGDTDIAVGVKDARYYEQVVFSRRVISKLLRWMIRTMLSMPVTDTQCGLKGFRANVKPLFLATTINRYLFDLEFIRNGFKKKYRIRAIPVVLNERVHIGKINYHVLLPEIFNFLKLLLK